MINLLLVIFLVFLNGFFVAAEFALVKVRQTRLAQLVSDGNKRAKYAQSISQQLDAYLSACQLGITLASLGLGWVGEPVIAELIVEPLLAGMASEAMIHTISIAIAFAIITFLHIVLGELAPKSLAIQKAESTSLWVAAPLMFFYKLSYPAIWLLNGTATFFLRLVGLTPASEHESAHTEEEIRLLVNESHKSGHIDQEEMDLVDNVFEFSERLAREIMIPRIDIVCLYDDNTFEENLEIIRESRHSRFPVAHEDKDRIIGFVHATDFYLTALTNGDRTKLENFIRPVLTVPESMEISHVLRLMQKRRSQLAIVIDEYGGTAGLITMEDILEEIVGDIQDEFDEHERPDIENNDNTLSVSGKTLLSELNDIIPVEIHSDDVDTIAGWLYSQLNEEVAKGKTVTYSNYVFTITELENHRITRVGIEQLETEENADEDGILMQAQ
ncbi:hemolysin family protein [Brevibacillus dissolubilis]|uniref:hemolysin family protein n=1 Tax=Brevibacillus dissolubilis TaxID=1844116 RepID=UPI0011173386|nr:hemolysin family protein [Brevibacillus dissolubilis]